MHSYNILTEIDEMTGQLNLIEAVDKKDDRIEKLEAEFSEQAAKGQQELQKKDQQLKGK